MITSFRLCASALAVLLAGAALLALPAGGAGKAAITCGMVVTTSITASNDLTNCAGDGLVVGANGITIDLMGTPSTATTRPDPLGSRSTGSTT